MRVSAPRDLVAAPSALALTRRSTIVSLLRVVVATPRQPPLSLLPLEVNPVPMRRDVSTVVVTTVRIT